MAQISCTTQVVVTATIMFDEAELRCLDAMAGYGADAFLRVFYEKLGTHYMKPYEPALRSLFKKITQDVKPAIYQADEAKRSLVKMRVKEEDRRKALIT